MIAALNQRGRWEDATARPRPGVKVQRCAAHKARNLADHCPAHARAEMKRDYHRIVFAADGLAARAAYDAFLTKWSKLCTAVARSLAESGLELITFYEFPKSMWKSLRTTNALENLNRELRRRTKAQASFSTEAAAVTLLYGLVAFGPSTLTGCHKATVLKLLAEVGACCERLLADMVRGVAVQNLQAAKVWATCATGRARRPARRSVTRKPEIPLLPARPWNPQRRNNCASVSMTSPEP
ncbi:MAG TPA: transposase [Thermoanaerobaculia bacterium]|nr:transposase [Thermoanaerobaculia bacterium]